MKEFKNYLTTKYNYAERTLQAKENHIENWKKLCLPAQPLEQLSTQEILSLIEIQKKKYRISTLNNQLKSLEQYYNYLLETQQRKDHPLKNFKIKPETNPIIQGLLTEQELTELYENYTTRSHLGGQFTHYRQRNKVIVGLMIYQGLDSSTLEKLEIGHIQLEKERIEIPKISDNKLNPRILPIKSIQKEELETYLKKTREELLKLVKAETRTNQLFPKSSKTRFSSITQAIKNQLSVEKLPTLRYSRIVLWMKQYNLREVQYKAGYKSLLSLEKFHSKDIEKLKQSIEKYHPF
ncbi:site-specific integrase [Apibacter sp. HY039]|uniref:tyrosine-type recombinase/integrase n=1 Tax=Apibacter sp. HY039 TaxID=2501476 RepID=UPI000FEBDB32|nr:site-specific integrase [Apibacter sp. HY039]